MHNFTKFSLKKKLLSAFSLIILFFSIVIAVLLSSQKELGSLQDEHNARFEDSDRIGQIASEVSSVYAVAADAIINQNLDETKKIWKL